MSPEPGVPDVENAGVPANPTGDPLDGAAVGETRTFQHETRVDTVSRLPPKYCGTDRDIDVSVADVEVVDSAHPDDPEDVRITYDVEATKYLPRRWDQCQEPRTEREERQARRKRWSKFALEASVTLVTIGAVVGLGTHITNKVTTGLTVGGETVDPIGPMVPVTVFVAVGILWALFHIAGVWENSGRGSL